MEEKGMKGGLDWEKRRKRGKEREMEAERNGGGDERVDGEGGREEVRMASPNFWDMAAPLYCIKCTLFLLA